MEHFNWTVLTNIITKNKPSYFFLTRIMLTVLSTMKSLHIERMEPDAEVFAEIIAKSKEFLNTLNIRKGEYCNRRYLYIQ